jgi:3-hydroxyisobutyrate dehydrogenase-like beta-hydroxyacid dehydrogenase
MTSSSLRVGLIGLGLMGRGIGHSLQRTGHRLGIVANRKREVAEELLAAGAWEAATPRELAAGCDAVVLCVSSVEASRDCLLGPQGVLQGAHPGLLVIESSTLLPAAALEFAAGLRDAGIAFVDAPVTRGPREAMEGRLNAIAGGAARDVERAGPVLRAYCERVFHMGGTGSGYAAKLVNNFLSFAQMAAIAEGVATAARAGLDLGQLMEAIAVSGGQSRVLDGLTPWIARGEEPRTLVTLSTAHKDVRYYRAFAEGLGSASGLSDTVLRSFEAAIGAGLAEAFTPAYLEQAAAQAGVDLAKARRRG